MSTSDVDIRTLNLRAVRYSVELVAKAAPADLGRPTPCAGWTLADLLAHMTAQHRGFAASSAGGGRDLADWAVSPVGDDAVRDYAAASEDVLAAFAEDGVLERKFVLPEFGDDPASPPVFPGRLAVGFHFIDYLVHGWDVARTLGLDYAPDADLLEPALAITMMVPDDERRRTDGAAFRPALSSDDADEPVLDRILRHLGRTPGWTAGDA